MDAEKFNELHKKKAIDRWKEVHQKESEYIQKNENRKLLSRALLFGYLAGDGHVG